MKERVVVYGLLRRGERMFDLLGGAPLLGEVRLPGYELRDLGRYPAAVPGEGGITGEVYEVFHIGLLDEAEGVHFDPPLYKRVRVEALGAPAWLYVYARDPEGAPRIASGDWKRR